MTAAPKRRPRGRPAGPGPAGERTREAILRAAHDVFSEQSYHAAGIAAIAERAGVPKGSFYYAFPSKDALVVALIDQIVAHDGKLVAALLDAHTDDPRRGIRAIFEGVRRRAARDGLHKACLIAKLTLEIGHVSDEAREALKRAYANWGGQIAAAISGIDRADGSTSRDSHRLAMVLLNSWQGALARAALEGTLDPLDDFIACALDTLLAEGASPR
ncbi:TetR family transcriptional regulator [bacterium]|nr:TetR family transcriptional regulator [bacterium]